MTATPTRSARRQFTLIDAGREFWRHPSSWMIGAMLVVAAGARIAYGDWQITDALVPAIMLAAFPFFEWLVHVCILHWRPRQVGALRLDPLLARKHREHHVDPRDIPLVFIPWQALLWVLPVAVGIALLAFPRTALGLTFLTFLAVLGLCYEWCHYLVHSDYKPKTAVVSGGLAQSPPAPLQERALLVHGHQRRHRRPGAGHLPRSGDGRHVTDGEEPARRVVTRRGSGTLARRNGRCARLIRQACQNRGRAYRDDPAGDGA